MKFKYFKNLIFILLLGLVGALGLERVEADDASLQLTVVHLATTSTQSRIITEFPKAGQAVEGVKYELYRVGEAETLDSLSNRSSSDLQAAYSHWSNQTDAEGKIIFSSLKAGRYYGRTVGTDNQNKASFLIDLQESSKTIYPKVTWETGGIQLQKIDAETKETLSGVKFQLFEKDGLTPLRFTADGRRTTDLTASDTLTTDHNGLIRLTGLLTGDYIFKEVETLEGYILPSSDFPVHLSEEAIASHSLVTITVENHQKPQTPPDTPQKPRKKFVLPKTGEIVSGGLVVGGLGLLFVLILKQYRKRKESE